MTRKKESFIWVVDLQILKKFPSYKNLYQPDFLMDYWYNQKKI